MTQNISSHPVGVVLLTCCCLFGACQFPEPPLIDGNEGGGDGGTGGDGGSGDDGPGPDAALRMITVEVDPPTGAGSVLAPAIGIDCGSSCTTQAFEGTSVTFQATPAAGAAFMGWRVDARDCAATASCDVSIPPSTVTIGARFAMLGQAGWVAHVAGTSIDEVTHVAADSDGNVIVVASFRGDAMFDGATYLGGGVILAKLSPAGDVLWKKAIAGLGGVTSNISGLAIHRTSGDIVLLGSFESPLDLGGPELLRLPTGDIRDGFVARFDADGAWKWQRHIQISDRDEHLLGGVVVDTAGDILVTGSFNEWIDVGDGRLTSTLQEVFLAKLSSANNTVVWRRKLGGSSSYANSFALTVDAAGNPAVGGTFAGTAQFGGPAVTPSGQVDGFLVSYDGASGTYRWQRQVGGTGTDSIRALAVDPVTGRLYAAMTYAIVGAETVTFSGASVSGTGGTGDDIVVASLLASDGSVRWAYRFGSAGADVPLALTVLADSRIALAGTYAGNIAFGATTLTHAGNGDGFVARLSNIDGAPSFAGRIASGANDTALTVTATPNSIVLGGSFTAQAQVVGRTVTPAAASDGYAVAVAPPP